MKFSLVICFTLCSIPTLAKPLNINTEEYAPLSYTEAGQIKGIATEQVELIMELAGVEYQMTVLPWTRAYNTAITNDNTCVFTTSNTPKRTNLFKWVEPLFLDTSILVKEQGNPIYLSTLEEAKQYRIGVQSQDVGGVYLADKGFTQLDEAKDVNQSILKLKAKRVDMVAMAEARFLSMQYEGRPVEKVIDIFSIKMGLACNKSVHDNIIKKLQAELDRLIQDGTQQSLIIKYQAVE